MKTTAVVSERGQVTIPHHLRRRLGLRPGQVLVFSEEAGRLVASKVQPEQIQRLYADKVAAVRTSTSVHHIHAVLHKACEQAGRWRLLMRNPCDLVDAQRMARHEMLVLSPEQARAFLDVAAEDRNAALDDRNVALESDNAALRAEKTPGTAPKRRARERRTGNAAGR